MNRLVDTTGKLLGNKKKPATRRDIPANTRVPGLHMLVVGEYKGRMYLVPSLAQVIAACIRGGRRGRKRQSAYIYMDAVLHFYNQCRLLPRGVLITAPSVQDWACRAGGAMRKLVVWLHWIA